MDCRANSRQKKMTQNFFSTISGDGVSAYRVTFERIRVNSAQIRITSMRIRVTQDPRSEFQINSLYQIFKFSCHENSSSHSLHVLVQPHDVLVQLHGLGNRAEITGARVASSVKENCDNEPMKIVTIVTMSKFIRIYSNKVNPTLWFRSVLGCGKFQLFGSHVSSFQNYSPTKAPKVSSDIWLSHKKQFL